MKREKEIDVAATHYDYGYYEDSKLSAYCCFRDGARINYFQDLKEAEDFAAHQNSFVR